MRLLLLLLFITKSVKIIFIVKYSLKTKKLLLCLHNISLIITGSWKISRFSSFVVSYWA